LTRLTQWVTGVKRLREIIFMAHWVQCPIGSMFPLKWEIVPVFPLKWEIVPVFPLK